MVLALDNYLVCYSCPFELIEDVDSMRLPKLVNQLYVMPYDYTLILHVEQRAKHELYIIFERTAVVHDIPLYISRIVCRQRQILCWLPDPEDPTDGDEANSRRPRAVQNRESRRPLAVQGWLQWQWPSTRGSV